MPAGRMWCQFAGALILSTGLSGLAAAQGLQPQADFENAIRTSSSSPYVVRITMVDDRTGEASTVCVNAQLLTGANYLENGGSFEARASGGAHGDFLKAERAKKLQEAADIAVANTSHIFHFSKPEALEAISRRYPEACAAIDQGKRARIADRTGQIRTEPSIAK